MGSISVSHLTHSQKKPGSHNRFLYTQNIFKRNSLIDSLAFNIFRDCSILCIEALLITRGSLIINEAYIQVMKMN